MCFSIIFFFLILAKPLLVSAIVLDVPFKSQVPPGTWDETRNCGQTSYLMIAGFYSNNSPDIESIKKLDDWIENIFGDSVRNYSGDYTSVDILKRVALEYGNFTDEQVDIYREGNMSFLKKNLELGNPIVIAVYTNMLLKGERKDRLHFMVLTGMDDEYVYVNDPGKTLGKNNQYTIEQFKLAWSKNNYASIIFKVNNQDSEEVFVEQSESIEPKPNTSIFHNITNFFKNIFHHDDESQAQEVALVESTEVVVIEETVEPEVPTVYDGIFLPSTVTIRVSPVDISATIPLTIKNTGNTTWKSNELSLNVVGGVGQNSAWYADAWKTKLRPAVISTAVGPGEEVLIRIPITLASDLTKDFRLQLVKQQGSTFVQVGSSFVTITFQMGAEIFPEESLVQDESILIIPEGKTVIEKIKDVSKVLGDKIIDTTKKVIDTVIPFFYSGGSSDSTTPEEVGSVKETILPSITIDTSFDDAFSLATTTVMLFGTKNLQATSVRSSIASTSFSFTSTTWEAHVPLLEGENVVIFTPIDDVESEGERVVFHIVSDTTPPEIMSFSSVPDTTISTLVHVDWSGNDETSSTIHYALQVNEDESGWNDISTSTTETSYIFSGERPHDYIFRIRAFDPLNNFSEWYESDTSVSLDWPKTAIVNEIAWGGTAGVPTQTRNCPKQEWMELKNTTDSVIDLSGWHLVFTSPTGVTSSLALSGTIDAGEYYLLARREKGQDALVSLSIDMVYEDIELDNAGMTLVLSDAEEHIIDEISFIDAWPAGGPGRSMERIGTGNQWKTTEHMSARGQANGCTNVLYGSPLQPNDRLWVLQNPFDQYPSLIDENGVLTLSVDHSPYVLSSEVTIPEGKTLVVDPGVTIIGNSAKATLIVEGAMIMNGTEELPARLTSSGIASDASWKNTFFGHGNPSPGDWSHIDVAGGGVLEMHYTEVSYGGDPFVTSNGFVYGTAQSQVIRTSGNITLDHVHLTNSYIHTNPNYTQYNAAIWMNGGSVVIINSEFDTGGIAIKNTPHSSGSVTIADTKFSNFTYPNGLIILDGVFPQLSGNNIFSDNVNNIIVVPTYEFSEDTTISSGAYVAFGSVTIPESVTLTVEEGGGIGIGSKNAFHIYGTLKTLGTAVSPVLINGWSGGWGRMIFYPGSHGELSYTHIAGGGETYNRERVMMDLSSADVSFDHTDISGGKWPGILLRIRNSDTTFSHDTIHFYTEWEKTFASWIMTAIDIRGGTTLMDSVFIRDVKYGIWGDSNTDVTAKNMDSTNFEHIAYSKWLPGSLLEFISDELPPDTTSALESI